MKLMSKQELAAALVCPLCRGGALQVVTGGLQCVGCSRSYLESDRGVISFLIDEQLSETNRNEIKGNTFDAEWEEKQLDKESWHPVLTQQMEWAVEVVARMLPEAADLYALGTGYGFDLRLLLRRRRFDRVFASDISPAATSFLGRALEEFSGTLGVFASEFERCPVPKRPGSLGLVFQALHHASDAHVALTTLLDHNFDDLMIVEPCTNPPLGVLARFDLVQRVEYTGTRPDWISLPRVRSLAKERGYRIASQTWWEIPPFIAVWLQHRPSFWRPCNQMFEAVSRATNLIKFGSMAAVHLTREPSR
jgi:hypothetical protein